MNTLTKKAQRVTLTLSVWDNRKAKGNGSIPSECKHLRSATTFEIGADTSSQDIENKIRSSLSDFIDNCPELQGFNRRNEGCFTGNHDGQNVGLPDSISVLLWNESDKSPCFVVKGDIHWVVHSFEITP